MATKNHFFSYDFFSIKHGSGIQFLEDKWLETSTLHEQYPSLFNIVCHKGENLANVNGNISTIYEV
jgi:hypothetical protein